ncbi:MAG: hypothetical protein KF729_29455 [Sandaracinaceae bacterium]|nr:hypothetical protein [Sandaracinaceae bacterium]
MRTLWAATLALTVLAPAIAAGQTRSLDIERFRPSPDRHGYLGIPGTRTPGPWAYDVSLWTGYASQPLTLRRLDTGELVPIVGHRVSGELAAQLGVLDRLAVVLHAPVVIWQEADASPLDGGPALASGAMRDAFLGVRARLLGEGSTPDHERVEGAGLAVQLGLTLPWGLEQQLAGEGNPQLEARVIGDFRFLDFAIGGEIGYRHRLAEPRLLGVLFRNELFFGGAIRTPTFLVENLSALLEVRVVTGLDADEPFHAPTTAVEGDLGARWADGDVALSWIVGTGLSGGVGTPGLRAMFGVELAPRTHDVDGDGIVDAEDQCPRMPEDLDGWQDDDGCPDLDNDGDLVPDADDRCPNEAADFDRDEDEDGCTDAVRDRDADGVDDGDDACPDVPEDADGWQDEDGCPDLDDDDDGIPDADDQCPREAEDRDGWQDEDGCPDPDDDGDGILDADDRCPREPEDRDGLEDEDGCPEPDDDRDGVLDADDRCPGQPETINDVEDGDGCPDTGGRARWIATGPGPLPPLRGVLRFSADGSVRAISAPSLDQLARHLIQRWGQRWTVAVPASDAPRQAALTAALTARGVLAATFEVVGDATLADGVVTVTRAP